MYTNLKHYFNVQFNNNNNKHQMHMAFLHKKVQIGHNLSNHIIELTLRKFKSNLLWADKNINLGIICKLKKS